MIYCLYSGGHCSALAAIEATRYYGKDNIVLLNHDISGRVENQEIKQYKIDVAKYLDIPLIYVPNEQDGCCTPLELARKYGFYTACNYYLKIRPFDDFLSSCSSNDVFCYGFDLNEQYRISRNRAQMRDFKTIYPLVDLPRTIRDTSEIGIPKPHCYCRHKHANCIGCVKAGRQQWYTYFFYYPDIFDELEYTERVLGYPLFPDWPCSKLRSLYQRMVSAGIAPDDFEDARVFWDRAYKGVFNG